MHESIAQERLTDQGFTVYLAEHETPHGTHGELRIRPMFPGYLFVQFDAAADRWRPIASTPGVRRLIPIGSTPECPIPVPAGLVEVFRDKADEHGVIRRVTIEAQPVAEGQLAYVIDGIYAGHIGICRWSTLERVCLMLSVLGGEVPVKMPASFVTSEDPTIDRAVIPR